MVEVSIDGGELEWKPGAKLVLVLADGRQLEVTVVAEASTRPGCLSSGQTARLALQLPQLVQASTIRRVLMVKSGLEIVFDAG